MCRKESLAVLQELVDAHRLLVVAATGSSFPSEKRRAGEVITSSHSDEHPGVICYALQEVPGARVYVCPSEGAAALSLCLSVSAQAATGRLWRWSAREREPWKPMPVQELLARWLELSAWCLKALLRFLSLKTTQQSILDAGSSLSVVWLSS